MKIRNTLRRLIWVIWVIVMILFAIPLLGQEEIHHIVADKYGNIYVSGTASGFFDEWSFVASFSPEGKKNWYRVMTGELALSKDGEAVLFHGDKRGVVEVSKTRPDRGLMKKTTFRLPKNQRVADVYLASNNTIQVLTSEKNHERIRYYRVEYDANGVLTRDQAVGAIDLDELRGRFSLYPFLDDKGNLTIIGNDQNGTSNYQRIIVHQFSRGKKVLEKNLELKKDFDGIKDLPILQDRKVRLAGSIGEYEFFTIDSDGKRMPFYPSHWKGQEQLFTVRRKDVADVYEMLGWADRVYVTGTKDVIVKGRFQEWLFIEEMDRQGNTIRSTNFGTRQNDSFGAFTVGPKGENYLVGNEKGGYLIVKYDSNGRMLWKKTYVNWVNKLCNLLVVMLGLAILCLVIYGIYIIHGLVHKNRKEG